MENPGQDDSGREEQATTLSHQEDLTCKAEGDGLQYGETDQTAEFQVHVTNATGEPCAERQEVSAELKSLQDGRVIQAEITQLSENVGSYKVSYKPTVRGRHTLTVLVNGSGIEGSPFAVFIQQPPTRIHGPLRVIEEVKYPYRATLSSSGSLLVTEEYGGILVFDAERKLVRTIESLERWYGRVKMSPGGIAVDDSDTMYVCDRASRKLFKVSPTGKVLKSVGGKGSRPGQFESPDGIALRGDRLYVCDSGNHRIQVFSSDLKLIESFGSSGKGEGEFHYPRDVAFDREGNMYVAEHANHRVQVFSPSGAFVRTFGEYRTIDSGNVRDLCGVCVNHNIVYVAEEHRRVSFFTTLGEYIGCCDEFDNPRGVTVDSDGYLYVCDSRHNRIKVF